MGSKLRKNAIITAYINSYCLVCEQSLDSSADTSDHIQEDVHKDKLVAHPYLEKYGDNHLRKVNKGYFCEFCGVLLATAAKVSLHIQEKTHYENKGTFLLRRTNGLSGVIAFDDVLISERAWHSLTEDTCAICNEEFENENIHKTETAHLLKLVQSKMEFAPGNAMYRRTDETSFQCLTCNSVFLLSTLDEHFTDPEHKELYIKCQEEMKKYLEQNKTANDAEKPTKADIKKNGNCDPKKVDKNHNITEKSPKQDLKTSDTGKALVVKPTTNKSVPEDEVTVYANANNLTYNAGNTNAFCRICETKIPASLRSMKEHVKGKEHKNKLAKSTQISLAAKDKPTITKKPMDKFVFSGIHVQNLFHHDVVINEKYCIAIASFLLVTRNGSKFRCHPCEENIYEDHINEHADKLTHRQGMQEAWVVTSLPESEFVREVRPGIYHCGFCNQAVTHWDEVSSHLQTREHNENKDACGWRLQRHMPALENRRRSEEMEMFRMLMSGFGPFRH